MKAVTFGGAMADSIAIVANDQVERMSMRNAQSSFLLLEEGRKIEADQISQHCGGGAVNTAVCMSRLGWDVSAVIKLGQDQRADLVLRRLEDESVSTRWVMRDSRSVTGASVIISSHERDAAIFTFRGANTLLEQNDLVAEMFGAELVYISGLSNGSADCFPQIVRMAKQAGAKVATNPGIRQLTSRAAPFLDALKDIDILSLNRVEADALVPLLIGKFGESHEPSQTEGGETAPELVSRGLGTGGYYMSLRGFVRAVIDCGATIVVITNGSDGAYAASTHIHHCPILPTKVAGTAGAGDAFASTFAAWLTRTGDVSAALRSASFNASSVIGFADTQTGLRRQNDVDQFLASKGNVTSISEWEI